MLEMMLGTGSGDVIVPSVPPLMGYNFDQGTSSSSAPATGYTGGSIQNHDQISGIAGYTQSMRCVNTHANLTPLYALSKLGTGDFTLEFYAWLFKLPNDYLNLILLLFTNGAYITIRMGNSSVYNYRMQVAVNSINYGCAVTAQSLQGDWHHYALVRKNGKCRFFIDGTLQMMAADGGTNYNVNEFTSMGSMTGELSAAYLGRANSGTSNIYMPEFLFTPTAKYTDSFTRPTGPIYRP